MAVYGFERIKEVQYGTTPHRRSQDFVWGALFFTKNVMTFLVVALKTDAKATSVTSPTVQISPIS